MAAVGGILLGWDLLNGYGRLRLLWFSPSHVLDAIRSDLKCLEQRIIIKTGPQFYSRFLSSHNTEP